MRLSSSLLACAFALVCNARLDLWECDDQRWWKAENNSAVNTMRVSDLKDFCWSCCGGRQQALREDTALHMQKEGIEYLIAKVVHAQDGMRSARQEVIKMNTSHTRELAQLAGIESQRRKEAVAKMQSEVDALAVQVTDAAAEAARARTGLESITAQMEEQLASMQEAH
eukprot:scaffold323734_cov24-Tisochrysis_lutea.AAC.1